MRILVLIIVGLILSNCSNSYVKNKKTITSPDDLMKFTNVWCEKQKQTNNTMPKSCHATNTGNFDHFRIRKILKLLIILHFHQISDRVPPDSFTGYSCCCQIRLNQNSFGIAAPKGCRTTHCAPTARTWPTSSNGPIAQAVTTSTRGKR